MAVLNVLNVKESMNVSRGTKRLLVETMIQSHMSLLICRFWTATVLTILKSGLELFKKKAFKVIPKHERTEAQSWS